MMWTTLESHYFGCYSTNNGLNLWDICSALGRKFRGRSTEGSSSGLTTAWESTLPFIWSLSFLSPCLSWSKDQPAAFLTSTRPAQGKRERTASSILLALLPFIWEQNILPIIFLAIILWDLSPSSGRAIFKTEHLAKGMKLSRTDRGPVHPWSQNKTHILWGREGEVGDVMGGELGVPCWISEWHRLSESLRPIPWKRLLVVVVVWEATQHF